MDEARMKNIDSGWVHGGFFTHFSLRACLNISLKRKKTTLQFLDWFASNSTFSVIWWVSRGLFDFLKCYSNFVFAYPCNTFFFFLRTVIFISFSKGI